MKEKARKLLQQIYTKYLSTGENGVYLYGSILRNDFNPETSDIDGIAIVDDNVPLELREQILAELTATMPELKRFGFQLLYKSELNGHEPKGRIAKVISPKALLLEMPYWEHVAGKTFSSNNFPPTNFNEAIADEMKIAVSRGWDDVKNVEEEKYGFFTKLLIYILYLQDEEVNGAKPFSYDIIRNLKTSLSEALLETKATQYNKTVFQRHMLIFQKFVDQLLSK